MKVLQNTKVWAIALITLILGMSTGCIKFKRHDPSPVGTFYPNHPIQGIYLTKDNIWKSDNKISFSQPAEIKAVGKMTWNSLIGNYYETALISPKLDHLPGDYWIHTEGDYFIRVDWLRANGRVVYTGTKTSTDYFWESGWGTITKILIFIISAFIVFQIIKWLINLSEINQTQIIKINQKKKNEKRQEGEKKKNNTYPPENKNTPKPKQGYQEDEEYWPPKEK